MGFTRCNIHVIPFVGSILIFFYIDVFIALRLSFIFVYGRYCYDVRFSDEDVGLLFLGGGNVRDWQKGYCDELLDGGARG